MNLQLGVDFGICEVELAALRRVGSHETCMRLSFRFISPKSHKVDEAPRSLHPAPRRYQSTPSKRKQRNNQDAIANYLPLSTPRDEQGDPPPPAWTVGDSKCRPARQVNRGRDDPRNAIRGSLVCLGKRGLRPFIAPRGRWYASHHRES